MEAELSRETLAQSASPGGSRIQSKDVFFATDLATIYLVQVLARSTTLSRRKIADEWITMMEKACRMFPELAQRVLERVCVKSDVWLKPILCECPSRAFRRRFAELLLLCAESDFAQMNQLNASEELSKNKLEGKDLEVPVIYLSQQQVPKSRVVWLVEVLSLIAESCTSSSASLPSAEFFALLLELTRLEPNNSTIKLLLSKKYGGPRTFLDLLARKGVRFATASKVSSINVFSTKKLGYGRVSSLAELVLELSQTEQSLPATFGDRFVEAVMKLRDFSSAVRGVGLFWASATDAVEKVLERITQGSQRSADDFALVGDVFRMHPRLHEESVKVVDVMVDIITKGMADTDTFAGDDVLNAFRCLGVVIAMCKPAQEHFKTQHKKATAAWPKDVTTAFKVQVKRSEIANGNGQSTLSTMSSLGGGRAVD